MTHIQSRYWNKMEKSTGNISKTEIDKDQFFYEIVDSFVDKRLRVPDVARKDG